MDDIAALRESLAGWDRLAHACALVALAGVALAATAQFARRLRLPGLARFPDWPQTVGVLGAVLAIGALAGEILAARNSRNISDRIAGELHARAAAATEASKTLKKEAAQLRLQLAKFKWRVISPEQMATLAEWLKKAPKGPVLILHKLDDETLSFAAQIRDALRGAGFDPKLEQGPAALTLPGTFLLVKDLKQPPPHAVAIQTAFREIHVDLDGQQDAQFVPNAATVVILIGSRRL